MLAALLVLTIVVWLGAVLYSLGQPRSIVRRRNPWIALLAVATAAGLSVLTYRENQRTQVRTKFQQHYHAALDERNRGNVEEAERQLRQAEQIIPGRPEVQKELKELQQPRPPAEKRVQTKATQVDRTAKPAPPPTAGTPPPDEKRPGEQPKPLAHLASPFEIIHYALDATLDPAKHTLDAVATIRVKSRGGEVRQLDFSLHPECKPFDIRVDGRPERFTHVNDLLSVFASRAVDSSRESVVTVNYRRAGEAVMGSGAGLISPGGCYFISEARWYPATGELDFRAPVRVKATVPKGYTVVSVGALKQVTRAEKTTTFLWETDRYASMVSLAAAKYVQQATTVAVPGAGGKAAGKATPVTCYTFAEHRDKAPFYLKEAAAIVRFYERRFGPYPYEKLAVVEIPLFPGGYGTTSFVMLLDKSFEVAKTDPFTREFLAHEIAHQWWGNMVFPQGMGAAWLSEAFANYSAWMYAEALSGNPRLLQKRVSKATGDYFEAARVQGDQPIGEADPYQPVGAKQEIIYEKGAVILHMLRQQVGDVVFRRILRKFADDYRFGKASIADFRKLVNAEAGVPLDWFFDQWLGRKGGMELTYSFETRPLNKQQNEAVLTVTQAKPAYHAKMKVVLQVENNVETREIELTGEQQEFKFPVKGKLQSVLLDPESAYLMRPPRWIVPEPTAATGG